MIKTTLKEIAHQRTLLLSDISTLIKECKEVTVRKNKAKSTILKVCFIDGFLSAVYNHPLKTREFSTLVTVGNVEQVAEFINTNKKP